MKKYFKNFEFEQKEFLEKLYNIKLNAKDTRAQVLILSFLKDFVLEKRQKLQLAFLDFCIAACACCSIVVAVVYQKNIVLSAPLWEILAVIVFAVAVLMIILFVIYKSVKSKNV